MLRAAGSTALWVLLAHPVSLKITPAIQVKSLAFLRAIFGRRKNDNGGPAFQEILSASASGNCWTKVYAPCIVRKERVLYALKSQQWASACNALIRVVILLPESSRIPIFVPEPPGSVMGR